MYSTNQVLYDPADPEGPSRRDLEHLCRALSRNCDGGLAVEESKFIVLHMGVYCRIPMIPAEWCIAEFGIRQGIVRSESATISPGKLPVGTSAEMRASIAKCGYDDPDFGSEVAVKEAVTFQTTLESFINKTVMSQDERPIIFTSAEIIEDVEGSLRFISTLSGKSFNIKILPIPILFQAVCKKKPNTPLYISKSRAESILKNMDFSCKLETGCNFHKINHKHEYLHSCSSAILHSWVYNLLNFCSDVFHVEKFEGTHFPARISQLTNSISQPWTITKICPNHAIHKIPMGCGRGLGRLNFNERSYASNQMTGWDPNDPSKAPANASYVLKIDKELADLAEKCRIRDLKEKERREFFMYNIGKLDKTRHYEGEDGDLKEFPPANSENLPSTEFPLTSSDSEQFSLSDVEVLRAPSSDEFSLSEADPEVMPVSEPDDFPRSSELDEFYLSESDSEVFAISDSDEFPFSNSEDEEIALSDFEQNPPANLLEHFPLTDVNSATTTNHEGNEFPIVDTARIELYYSDSISEDNKSGLTELQRRLIDFKEEPQPIEDNRNEIVNES